MNPSLKRTLGLWDLVFMNIVAIVGLRWLLTAARTGYSSLILWGLALAVFFIPQGYAIHILSRKYPQEGGIYVWTRELFGSKHGFMAGWCYWINNLIYYPALLMFLAGNALFIFGSRYAHLTDDRLYIALFSLIMLWLVILINVRGLSLGKWIHNFGGIGVWIPIGALIALAFAYLIKEGPAEPFRWRALVPEFSNSSTWSFWATMCFGFAGLELMSLLGEEIKKPLRNIPRAIVISGIAITAVYVLGTFALLVALPKSEIGLLAGIVQSIGTLSEHFDLAWLGILSALFIALSGVGGVSAWIAGVARVPFVIGLDRYLPSALGKLHPKWQTPHVSLLVQGGLTTLFILFSVVGSTVEEAYLVLLDAEIILYFIPYLYMFAAAYRVGKANWRGRWAGILGFTATALAMLFALIPPEGVNALMFEVKVIGGTVVFVGSGMLIYWRRKK
ncbi:MAG: amino acid permease [Candidatus Marinimicrobia bacterium]|nr:amino acid permease [Candidatus Neomarinimicrobiota bacterium]